VRQQAAPAVRFRWVLPGGRALNFQTRSRRRPTRWPEGTLELAADMLTEGTRRHPGNSFAAALDRHGGSLSADVLADGVIVQGSALSHQLEPTLRLVAEALAGPSFDRKALSNLIGRYKAHLENSERRPKSLATRLMNRLLYGPSSAYGSPGPTLDSLGQIRGRDVKAAFRAAFGLGGSTLVVVGDVEPGAIAKQLEGVFGGALRSRGAGHVSNDTRFEPEAGCHVIDIPGAAQTVLLRGNRTITRRSEDRPALRLANQVLGGSASSRLFTELREKRGLTYGVYSSLDTRREAGDWTASTSVGTPKTEAALEVLIAEIDRMRAAPPTAAELDTARSFLIGQYALHLADGGRVADYLAALPLYELSDGQLDAAVQKMAEIEPAALGPLTEAQIGASPVVTVIVGDLAAVRPGIDGFCPRIVQWDTRLERKGLLLADHAELDPAMRDRLFASWLKSARTDDGANVPVAESAGLRALARFVRRTRLSTKQRAAALVALTGAGRGTDALDIGATAADWPTLAGEFELQLAAMLSVVPPDESRPYKDTLLDLADRSGPMPADGPLLGEAGARTARRTVAEWALGPHHGDGDTAVIREHAEARIDVADLPRLARGGSEVLAEFIAADVWRTPSAEALVGDHDEEAARAMVSAYRRVLFGRDKPASPDDLSLLSRALVPEAVELLVALHLRWQGREGDAAAAQTSALMTTLRQLVRRLEEAPVDLAGATPADDGDGSFAGSLTRRHFPRLRLLFAGMLRYPRTDDRWYGATMLVRHDGENGLRRVLNDIADDEAYRLQADENDPKLSIANLVRDEVSRIEASRLRPVMNATLYAPNRVGKVIAITTLKLVADPSAIDALKTHEDATRVGDVIAVTEPVTITDLAAAAMDVITYETEITGAVSAGRLTAAAGRVHTHLAFETFHLRDKALRVAVAKRAEAELGPATPRDTPAKPVEPAAPGEATP
jgi:zinc protease